MTPAITVANLSKQYRLGAREGQSYRTLRESIATTVRAGLGRLRRRPTGDRADTFWALKDVSFDVPPGEVVGIIGRNGAGKSTLLKILSSITEPTGGRVTYRGRIASLLEVGTGFHPELTGRENIYLNGSILGMTRREIGRKFDEIVAFAEIDRFLDTPVKRYSSGMYVRLAFAVASTLEPEILVIDEVLAVGDQGFQRKCLGKMGEVSRSARTVLFVSHNMAAVQNLCKHVAVLDRGRLLFFGPCAKGVELYMRGSHTPDGGKVDLADGTRRGAGGPPVFRKLRLLNGSGEPTDQLACGEPMAIEFETDWRGPPTAANFYVGVNDAFGTRLFTVGTFLAKAVPFDLPGARRVVCKLSALPLAPGRYCLDVFAKPPHLPPLDERRDAAWFDVVPVDFYGNGRLPDPGLGTFLVRSDWSAGA